jgi:hypothetical protein
LESLRPDVEALSAIERGAATPGERRSAEWVAQRLRQAGARDVTVSGFRYQRSWAYGSVPASLAGLAAARLGGVRGAALALAALATYEADFTGRSQWLRDLLPKHDAHNVTARIPAAGERLRTVVLVAHHDAAHTGWIWNPKVTESGRRRAAETGKTPPFSAPAFAAAGLVALGSLLGLRLPRLVGGAIFAGGALAAVQCARSPVVPGASDNASGVAGVIALAELYAGEPLDATEVLIVVPGCEESGMGGMRAWMEDAGRRLDARSTLVVGLDTLGAGEPVVATGEGMTGHYREEDLAWADRGAERAGLPAPRRFRLGGWTDPLVAVNAGLPAVSLLSIRDGGFTNYHLPTDTPERVDWQSVETCVKLAAGVVGAWAADRAR